MSPQQLSTFLQFSVTNKFPILVKGKPGIGKTDIIKQVAAKLNVDLLISHPVVSDPTDFKGLPFASGDGQAHFLPFGDLKQLIDAERPTVCFFDDIGQAAVSVQAALMQLLLSRHIGEHKVSDQVTFVAATNRKSDKAGVNGLLEPVKSRFVSIVELEVHTDDWVTWAFAHKMPLELISFIRYRPQLLENFEPTKDLTNSPSPRTIAHIGKLQQAGLPADLESEAFIGAVGEAFAAEYRGFLALWREIPNIDVILMNPQTAPVSENAAVRYATSSALSHRVSEQTLEAAITYMDRLPAELGVVFMKDTFRQKQDLANTKPAIDWMIRNGQSGLLL